MPPTPALSHITVLDLTRVRSGPTCVRQLADWGANVVKIEPPEALDGSVGMGGERHGPDFQNIHRNKRGLTLNLKDPDGLAVFRRLAAKADVVVENYRPDVKRRLGIDYPELSAINPAVVLASISGFGEDGPYADRPGFDQVAQGMGGLMSVTGLPGQGPVRVGIPVADLSAGLYAAIGILIALVERQVSGRGQWIRTSLIEAQIAMLDFQAARWTIAGEVAGQAGNDHPTSIPTGVFQTVDGPVTIAAGGEAMWQRLCDALGADDLRRDPDFADDDLRSRNRVKLNAGIQRHLKDGTQESWVDRLNEAGVPAGPIYSIDRMFADPHVRHLSMERPVAHSALGTIDVVGHPVRMNRSGLAEYRAAPERGQHTDEILAEFGFDPDTVADLRRRGIV